MRSAISRVRASISASSRNTSKALAVLHERRGVGYAHRLRQVTDRAVAVERHGARGGLLLARDDAQQRGFAGAVAAHEADAVSGLIRNEILSKRVQPP